MRAQAAGKNGSPSSAPAGGEQYDYDLIVIGCGVGGHGAALHAVDCGLKVAVIEGHDIGGTCVNRGCVPSKALLAASNEVRKLRNDHHQKTLGIQLNGVATFDRQAIADHATNLASTVQGNLQRSLDSLGVVSAGAGQGGSRDAGKPQGAHGHPTWSLWAADWPILAGGTHHYLAVRPLGGSRAAL